MISRRLDSPLQVNLSGMQLMEASAGTGKTWTLSSVYVLLVMGHGTQEATLANLMPRDILVVTFTNAAAAELRDRIRKRLEDAARTLQSGLAPAGDSFLRDLLAAYPVEDERNQKAWRLRKASEAMDEAAIHTIHGWCQHVLGQHAFDSGAGFHRNLETRTTRWWRECVQDYWRTHVLPLPLPAIELLAGWWSAPDTLMSELKGLVVHDVDVSAASKSLTAMFQPLVDEALACRQAFLEEKEAIETAWRSAIAAGILHKRWRPQSSIELRWAVLLKWSGSATAGWPTLDGDIAADMKWWGQSEWKRMTTGDRDPPRHPWFEAVEALSARIDTSALRIQCLEHALAWVKHRLVSVKEWRAWMDFDDLVKDVHAACNGPAGQRFTRILARQYPVAMIDEFQDTDERQYGIFRSIHEARADGMLLMIGDPKQAIYAFRGADIHTYLRARQDAAGNLCTLAVNHRSTTPMVSAVNAFFGSPSTQSRGGPFLNAGIPYVNVSARGLPSEFRHGGQPVPAMTIWHVQGERLKRKDWRAVMASHCAARIAELLAGPSAFVDTEGRQVPLTASGIAVLVRSGADAGVMAEQLSLRGVRSVFLSERGSVFACPEARAVSCWLLAVANPSDEQAVRRALADPVLCQTLSELDILQQDDQAWEAKAQQCRHWLQQWRTQGVMPMLRDFLRCHQTPSRLLATGQAGERSLTNILHLAEWLQEQSVRVEGERALIALLENAVREAESGDDGEENILRLESDEQRVRIVTLHKSKGLEYDLVFMPFVADPVRVADAPFRFQDNDGQWRCCWTNPVLDDGDTAWQKSMREQLAEEIRLLYVGLTRSRHACWIGVAAVEPRMVPKSHVAHGDPQVTDRALAHHPLAWLLAGASSLDGEALAATLKQLVQQCEHIALAPLLITDKPSEITVSTTLDSWTPQLLTAGRCLTTQWNIGSFSSWAHGRVELASWDVRQRDENPLRIPDAAISLPRDGVGDSSVSAEQPLLLTSYPAGAAYGDLLHKVLEASAEQGFSVVLNVMDASARQDMVVSVCARQGRPECAAALAEWLPAFLAAPLPPLGGQCLGAMAKQDYLYEMAFWFEFLPHDLAVLDKFICEHERPDLPRAVLQHRQVEGMLTGAIDLVIRHDERFYVVDYKSNRFDAGAHEYTEGRLWTHMLEHRYDLQYALYTLALHRHLRVRMGAAYDYDRCMGGTVYLFVRGIDDRGRGVFFRRVPRALIEKLDALMGGHH